MKKKLRGILTLLCTISFLFIFSCGILAAEADVYADEEGDDGISVVSPLTVLPETITTSATNGNLIVVLDPGHGGSESGTYTVASGSTGLYEKYYNLKVAQYCKAYLEQNYGGKVSVFLTRTGDTVLSRPERAQIAAGYGADLMLSIHFNGSSNSSANGGEVYVSCLEEYALTGLGNQIVNNLGNLGIKKRGVFTRDSEDGTRWTDGIRLADYYGIIKYPAYYEIPSCIIEHCFLTNSSDYTFANSEDDLKKLGEADAKAIATYYSLGSESSTTIENTRYTAKNQLTTYYNSLDLTDYSATYQAKINSVYQDAVSRIDLANGTGKINLTLDRTLKTIKNYPTSILGFNDVKRSDWFCNAVIYSVENKLFNGTSVTTFSPRSSITRGMFITVLGRSSGVSGTTPVNTAFSDVNANFYYAPYIAWAANNDIVNGMTDTTFAPDTAISREDLVTMVYRYAEAENISVNGNTGKTVADFNDGAKVNSWALEAMNWAVAHGVINGDDLGMLNPQSYCNRAEAAKIMMVFKQQNS